MSAIVNFFANLFAYKPRKQEVYVITAYDAEKGFVRDVAVYDAAEYAKADAKFRYACSIYGSQNVTFFSRIVNAD